MLENWFVLSANGRNIAQSTDFDKLLKAGRAFNSPFEIYETVQFTDGTTSNEIKYREYLAIADYR